MALPGSGCDGSEFRHLGPVRTWQGRPIKRPLFAAILAREAIPTRSMKYEPKGVQFLYARHRATG